MQKHFKPKLLKMCKHFPNLKKKMETHMDFSNFKKRTAPSFLKRKKCKCKSISQTEIIGNAEASYKPTIL